MMKRIHKGDEVIVIAGKNKGRQGKVLSVQGDKIVVEGVNVVSKHVKPNPQLGTEGGIEKREAPIHVSNVKIFNSATGKGDRVGFRFEDGVKVRFFKSNGAKVG
ncbi:MAG: 50S ribosomal protein L24 [Cardiobacteriaceae bacterium]|nr:50S ribosomal protein L24 [Cardiobacteriaceae bacterium]